MTLPLFAPRLSSQLTEAVGQLAAAEDTERGAVYTRPAVVDALLDLCGYTADQPLWARRLLEPSFGGGDFLLPALERLWGSFVASGRGPQEAALLTPALCAVELQPSAFAQTQARVRDRLLGWGVLPAGADALCAAWLRCEDFLLAPIEGPFDVVVGNPPYVRQERIPGPLLEEYRRRYRTIYDRADLYVPFYERGLALLAEGGRLGFICANRWLKNKYGGPLRKVAAAFHLECFVDLEGADAFQSEVIAYPAITVFARRPPGLTRVARKPELSAASLGPLVRGLQGRGAGDPRVETVERAMDGDDPVLLDAPDRLRVLRRLESAFPTLEAAGAKVGIGVATGADKVFIGAFDGLPVEASRKLPLVMAGDLDGLTLRWSGKGVINPFLEDGRLADLDEFPRFGAYLRAHEEAVAGRHCAQKSAAGWYRTIDRIWPALVARPKLLIPDIKGEPTVVLDEGRFYPHHNLYFVVSDLWSLPALATVLRSSLALFFVSSYSVRMAGGFLRFQAQYLRRIRLPAWSSLSTGAQGALQAASGTLDLEQIDAAVARAYALSTEEAALVGAAAAEARVSRKTPR